MHYKKSSIGKASGFVGFFKQLKLRFSCIGSVICRSLLPFDIEDRKEKRENRTKALNSVFFTVVSFLLGIARLNMGIYPFGLSALISGYGKTSYFCFFGSAISTLFQGYGGIIQFIIFFLIFLLRKTISKGKFNENLKARVLSAFVSSFFIGICSITLGKITFTSILAVTSYIILSTGCTYLFSGIFTNQKLSNTQFILSVYALCACLMPGFSRISSKSIDLSLIFACLVTLWISKSKGPIYGCVAGFIMGFSCINPLNSAILGISGMVSGFLFGKSISMAVLTFPICCFFTSVYILGTTNLLSLSIHILVSSITFLFLQKSIPDIFKAKSHVQSSGKIDKSQLKEFEKVSDSLSGLSSIIYKFAEHLKSPGHFETGAVFDNSFSQVCSTCSMSSLCYSKKECNFPAVRSKVISILRSRPLKEEELSDMLLGKCIKARNLCDCINTAYSELNFLTMKSNRTQTVACLYNSMSHLIRSTSKKESDNKLRDEHLENSVSSALKKIGVEFSYVRVKGIRCKEIFVHGIRADKIPCSSKDLSEYLSSECKTKLSEPCFDISDNADLIMKLTRGEIISLEYAQFCEAKSPEEVNGDTICLFDNDSGYFYSIIADGMGSGKSAAATSRLSCVFLQKMLSTGSAKNICLELLNNLLLSKNDETFSTVDMLEVDKLNATAYFIKAGAAPSFVLRRNHLYKISSETPPVGIIPAFSAESTRFGLEKGDIIFMVSDGVIQSDADAIWLSDLINENFNHEPALLAKRLIERSRESGVRNDDASACVIKVI